MATVNPPVSPDSEASSRQGNQPPADGKAGGKTKRVSYRDYVDGQLRKTRSQVKWVEISGALITLSAALMGALLIVALFDHWVMPLGTFMRWLVLVAVVGGAAYYVVRRVIPLFVRKINTVYAAHTIEQHAPVLKNSLVNLLLLRGNRDGVSRSVLKAVEGQAATRLTHAAPDSAVDRSRVLKLSYVLLGLLLVLALYGLFSPKSTLATVQRIAAPWANIDAPTRVMIAEVTPGSTSVVGEEFVDVKARVSGVDEDEPVTLYYSTSDRRVVDRPLPMEMLDGMTSYSCTFPEGTAGAQEGLEYTYYVASGDARSETFTVTVNAPPRLSVTNVEYEFPAYTRTPGYAQPHSAHITAMEGTRVTITAEANQPIDSAWIDFNSDGRSDEIMEVHGSSEAVATFTLPYLQQNGQPVASPYRDYRVIFKNRGGETNEARAISHPVQITPDMPPLVQILEPREPLVRVPVNSSVKIAVRAFDQDYDLTSVMVLGERDDRARDMVFEHSLLSKPQHEEFTGEFQFSPAQYNLKPGDKIRYSALARDNRHEGNRPASNRTIAPRANEEVLRIEVIEATTNPNQQQQQQDQQNEQGGEQNQDQNNQGQGQGDGRQDNNQANSDQSDQNNDQENSGENSEGQNNNEGQAGDQGDGQNQDGDSQDGRGQQGNQQDQFDALSKGAEQQQQDQADGQQQDQGQEQNQQDAGQQDADQQRGAQQDQDQQQRNANQDQAGNQNDQQNAGQSDQQQGNQQQADQRNDGQNSAGGDQNQGDQNQDQARDDQSGAGGGGDQNQGQSGQTGATDGQQSDDNSGNAGQNNQTDGAQQRQNDSANQADGDQNAQNANQQGAQNADNQNADNQGADARNNAGQGAQNDQTHANQANQADGQQADNSGGSGTDKQNANQGADGQNADGQQNTQTDGDPQNANKTGSGQDQQQDQQQQNQAGDEQGGVDASQQQKRDGDGTDSQEGANKTAEPPKGDDQGTQSGGAQDQQRGNAGGGQSNNDDNKGAPHQYENQKVKDDKTDRNDGSEPPKSDDTQAGSTSKSESNSAKSDADKGDRSGQGTSGGGQQANDKGTGGAGSNTDSKEGANASDSQGQGETGNKAGDDVKAEQQTGNSGQEQGAGSATRDGQGNSGEGTRPNQQQSADENQADQQAGDRNDANNQGQQQGQTPPNQGDQQNDNNGNQAEDGQNGPNSGGGTRGVRSEDGPTEEPTGSDPDLDAALKKTDLILDNQDELLEQYDSDKELQKRFPDKAAMEKFLDNLRQQREEARKAGAEGEAARTALRNLGSGKLEGNSESDDLVGVRQGQRTSPPPEYADQYRASQRSKRDRRPER